MEKGSGSRPVTGALGALSLNGSKPPSRSGTASGTAGRLATGSRVQTASDAHMNALAQRLVLRLRAKFGEAAADVKAQEIIGQEVSAFMRQAKGASIKEEDINALEGRIHRRLTGGTPGSPRLTTTLAADKRAQVEGDEWAKIFEFSIKVGEEKDKRAAEAARERQRLVKAQLDAQMRELEARKKAEHDEEIAFFNQEQAALSEYQRQEEARKKLAADIANKLRAEREQQLREKTERRERAQAKVRAEDADLANRIAYATRAELEAEEASRTQAKQQLRHFLAANEDNKALKEQAKKAEWEADQRYRVEWEALLDKQDRERREKLERAKAHQARTAERVKDLAEYKKWVDPAVIEKHWREREAKLDADEAARKERVRQSGTLMARTLDHQIREREENTRRIKEQDEAKARVVLERAVAEERREAERKAAALATKLKFRADLEAQMKDNVEKRRFMPMSEAERKINSQLLGQVQTWKSTGRVDIEAK